MGRIRLSYGTAGLTDMSILAALVMIARTGYEAIELALHPRQFNPYDLTAEALAEVKEYLARARITPACIATGTYGFAATRPHEPSLISLDLAGRKRRIDLIKRGIRIARELQVPFVSFGSGAVRAEHLQNPAINTNALLVDGIRECLREIPTDDEITLLIEPEPGMYIDTLEQALQLIATVGSSHFGLHVDICHAACSEPDYVEALARVARTARYLHVSDARAGHNVLLVTENAVGHTDLESANVLVYFPESGDFLWVDRTQPLYFCDQPPAPAEQGRIAMLLEDAGVTAHSSPVGYSALYAGHSALDEEISTYLNSVPGLSFEVLERARPVIAYLRGVQGPARIAEHIANTRTGVAHFHEIPGDGVLDFSDSFKVLTDHGFDGYATVDLDHHAKSVQQAIEQSYQYLAAATRPRPSAKAGHLC